MPATPLAAFGTLLQVIAVVLGVVVGYQARPALWSLLIIGVVFQIAYTFIRLPQISGLWQRDGIGGGMKLLFYQLCINAMIGAFFYGIGFGVGLLAK